MMVLVVIPIGLMREWLINLVQLKETHFFYQGVGFISLAEMEMSPLS